MNVKTFSEFLNEEYRFTIAHNKINASNDEEEYPDFVIVCDDDADASKAIETSIEPYSEFNSGSVSYDCSEDSVEDIANRFADMCSKIQCIYNKATKELIIWMDERTTEEFTGTEEDTERMCDEYGINSDKLSF